MRGLQILKKAKKSYFRKIKSGTPHGSAVNNTYRDIMKTWNMHKLKNSEITTLKGTMEVELVWDTRIRMLIRISKGDESEDKSRCT